MRLDATGDGQEGYAIPNDNTSAVRTLTTPGIAMSVVWVTGITPADAKANDRNYQPLGQNATRDFASLEDGYYMVTTEIDANE